MLILRPEQHRVYSNLAEILSPSNDPWWLAGGISSANVVAAYQPKGASDQAASYTNLANPGTFDITALVAPSWAAATGWSFNGSQYVNTSITGVAGTYSVYFRYGSLTSSAPNTYISGVQVGTPPPRFAIRYSGGALQFWQANGQTGTSPSTSGGTAGLVGTQGYYNGSATGPAVTASAANSNALWIGGLNNAGTVFQPFIGSILAFAVYNAVLSGAQVTALHTAMNTL
jgi:hypothetical protein